VAGMFRIDAEALENGTVLYCNDVFRFLRA
jgi:hypothetical protein